MATTERVGLHTERDDFKAELAMPGRNSLSLHPIIDRLTNA